ncbi:DUF4097 family beta strand repeat-containing protein [Microbispora siamensis]|nr:DUF4097 family beta strand repeat-containing protein [Microbispora siamensis]
MRHKTMAVVGAVLGMSLAVAACDVKLNIGGGEQDTMSYDVKDAVTAIDAHTGAGDIVVTETGRTGVHVTETRHWRGDKPADGHSVSGGTLTLAYECDNCWVDYRVEVPHGVRLKLDSGSGNVTLRNATGPVEVTTGSGDVDSRGLAGKQVTANTGAGNVRLRFTAVPDLVRAETGAGDAHLWVPAATYNVTVETGIGDGKIGVPVDHSAPRTIVVKTGAGDAEVNKL